ncbi:MAG: alpha/beta hydrolase [Cyclobacteriaceae bacterium]
MEKFKKFTITAEDNYQLSARIYKTDTSDRVILVAGATGVPQRYYLRFANAMNHLGYTVITFDYRGIADSKYTSLKGFQASILDWALLDFSAMVRWTNKRFGRPLVIGHSLGGHVYGLIREANETSGLLTYGTGAGWHGWMPATEKYKVWLLWNILAPILSGIYGYLPSSLIGIGEDLPFQVYKQWKHWCHYPQYWFDDSRYEFSNNFSAVTRPVSSVNSIDDLWAPPMSAKAFMKFYSQADLSVITVKPSDYQVKNIGHMGYFHSNCLPVTTGQVTEFYDKCITH